MKTVKSIFMLVALAATSAMMVNAQPQRAVTSREAQRKVTIAETTPQTEPSEYRELRCRGGAGLSLSSVEGRTNSSGEQTSYMTINFKSAAQPADPFGRNLQSGQCAFPDRPLRSDEPDQIIMEIVYFGQTRQQLHGSAVDSSPTAAERFPDAQNVPRYLADPKHYWIFYVRQNGPLPSGRFEASYGKFWKPAPPLRPTDKIKRTQP